MKDVIWVFSCFFRFNYVICIKNFQSLIVEKSKGEKKGGVISIADPVKFEGTSPVEQIFGGRKFKKSIDPNRDCYQKDRDRK